MATALIVIGLVLICVLTCRSYMRKLRYGCCGGDTQEVRIKVSDRNEEHYPYHITFSVEDMHCKNCAQRIESRLQELDGVWATAHLAEKTVWVRMKKEYDAETLAQQIRRAGYHPVAQQKNGAA